MRGEHIGKGIKPTFFLQVCAIPLTSTGHSVDLSFRNLRLLPCCSRAHCWLRPRSLPRHWPLLALHRVGTTSLLILARPIPSSLPSMQRAVISLRSNTEEKSCSRRRRDRTSRLGWALQLSSTRRLAVSHISLTSGLGADRINQANMSRLLARLVP